MGGRFFLKDFGGQISYRTPPKFFVPGTMRITYHPPMGKNTENNRLKSIKKTGNLSVTSLKFQIVQLKICPESDHFLVPFQLWGCIKLHESFDDEKRTAFQQLGVGALCKNLEVRG